MRNEAERLRRLLEPSVVGLGYELVGVELQGQGVRSLLRLYIDRPEGVTLDDCERVSRQVSGVLDVEVERSSGNRNLDREAVKAARRWRFNPEVRDGKKIASRVRVPVEFKLN